MSGRQIDFINPSLRSHQIGQRLFSIYNSCLSELERQSVS